MELKWHGQFKNNWHGKWIWTDSFKPRYQNKLGSKREYIGMTKDEENSFILLRKKFEINPNLVNVTINITADSRYKLYVNGKYIGRGINRCESTYWYYNSYDITKEVKEGRNVVAIKARFLGRAFADYTPPERPGKGKLNAAKGGVLFDIKIEHKDSIQWIGSDSDTKVKTNLGQAKNMPMKGCRSYLEKYDSTKVPIHWNEVHLDDSDWDKPIELDYPINTLVLDPNAPLDEEFQCPEEILNIGESKDIWEELEEEEKEEIDFNSQHMLEGQPEPLTNFEIKNSESICKSSPESYEICEIIPKEGSDPTGKVVSIYVKFDKEYVGYPQIRVNGAKDTIVDIMVGEKNRGYCPEYDYLNDKSGFRLVLRGGKQFYEQWSWKGYLYMLIKVRNITGPVKIYSVGTNQIHMRTLDENEGSFTCDNEDLNKLWKVCAHTLLSCGIDAYLDCPQREQRCYLGDAYPETLIANACFGEPRLTKKLIFDSCMGQRSDGLMYSFHPGDAKAENHIIPDYTLYLLQITNDYYQYYGDEDVLKQTFPHFLNAIDWFWKYLDPKDQLLHGVPYWCFIDWSFPHHKPGKWAILSAQFMDVLYFMSKVSIKFGQYDLGSKFSKQANAMKKSIEETFWDENQQCYRDYILEDGSLHGLSYSTNSYLILKDIVPKLKIEPTVKRIFEYEGSEEKIKLQIDDYYDKKQSHHAFGDNLKENIIVSQPFFMHHVNKMFNKIGRNDLLMFYLKKWIPMMSIGKTGTIWETWSIHGSECHAWAATPAFDLSTYWMGVKPLRPGFEEIEIAPTFYELNKVEGSFPTCKGPVKVRWDKLSNILVNIEIELPKAIKKGKLTIPFLNGRPPTGEVFRELSPGFNNFRIDYSL